MNWCILIPLLVGAICGLLGYLLGKSLGGGNNNNDYESRINRLQADLEACKTSKTTLEGDLRAAKASANTNNTSASHNLGNVASSLTGATTVVAFDAAAAKAVFGKKIKENDLTVVEGIGPKIQELFHNHDIKTWKALAECTVEKCQEVLNSGGPRFKTHKPGTWPKQSLLASQGKWQELFDWQDELDGGV